MLSSCAVSKRFQTLHVLSLETKFPKTHPLQIPRSNLNRQWRKQVRATCNMQIMHAYKTKKKHNFPINPILSLIAQTIFQPLPLCYSNIAMENQPLSSVIFPSNLHFIGFPMFPPYLLHTFHIASGISPGQAASGARKMGVHRPWTNSSAWPGMAWNDHQQQKTKRNTMTLVNIITNHPSFLPFPSISNHLNFGERHHLSPL